MGIADRSDVIKMIDKCTDCGATLEVPHDSEVGEIVECPDCGLDFILVEIDGQLGLKELAIEGEDWGE